MVRALSDNQLICEFAETRSEEAFSELARRHIDLVHSAAIRMVCDSHLAQDVTQGTFLALSRSASRLKDCAFLSAWLHRTAQNIAAQTVRTEARRRVREEKASIMNETFAEEPEPRWSEVAPHLDTALGELNEQDRGLVLQRYFERKTAREMSATLGISEEAAQRRVSRAVQRLRDFFEKRGVTVGTSGIIALVSANAVQAAPAGLAASVTASIAVAGTAAAASTATLNIFKLMVTAWLKPVLITGMVLGVSVAALVQHSRLQTLADDKRRLQTELEKREEAFASVMEKAKPGADITDNLRQAELLKLRAEVSRLRALEEEMAKGAQEALKQEAGRAQAARDTAREAAVEQFDAKLASHVSAFKQLGLKLRVMDQKKILNEAFAVDGQMNPALLSQELPQFDLSQVEFLLPDRSILGRLTDEEPGTIIARSRAAERNPDGEWTRVYLLADGSVQRKSTAAPNQAYEGKWQLREGN